MPHKWLIFLSISVIMVITFSFFIMYLLPVEINNPQIEALKKSANSPTVTYINPQLGPIEAPVTIINFSDFSCPACRQLAQSLAALREQYPQKVRIVWRNLPNDELHPLATSAAVAAHCAFQQNAFWAYHDNLFNQKIINEQQLMAAAELLELDMDAFVNCYVNQETLPVIQHDLAEAQALQLDATPTLFINGQRFTSALSYSQLFQYVNQFLD